MKWALKTTEMDSPINGPAIPRTLELLVPVLTGGLSLFILASIFTAVVAFPRLSPH